ncbi:Tetratricopeptide (TPR) repeat [Methanophagales archaeon]|nr:Tetratricopeptide (TPR) repeat [Methanophagales archaeon]
MIDKLTLDLKQFPVTPYIAHPYALQANFTGRKQERKMLTDWLTGGNHPMLSVIAIGGMGKTALAWYWLMEDIKGSDEQPRKIVWWSFYDYESGFGRFLKKAIEYFCDDEVDWNSLESTRDQMEFLYKILCDNRFILVLDGVERVLRAYYNLGSPYQGDEVKEDERVDFRACIEPNCGMFLQWLGSGNPRTKTLLTSRLFPKELDDFDGVVSKGLKAMDKEDAVDFFKRQGVKGTRAEIEEVCRAYGFHPLSLRLLSGMIIRDLRYHCDIKAWTRHNPLPKLLPKEHNILELAYNSLDEKKQRLISRISAFRSPMNYDTVAIFNDFGSEEKFNGVLRELVDRGLLFREEKRAKVKLDMHPIVRWYCYKERLTDKEKVHSKLRDYFATIPEPERIESVNDLTSVIELYQHTVRAGGYDEAMVLFHNRLHGDLYYKFGAYQTIIELLRALSPEREDKVPRLKNELAQAWTLNALANSYANSGRSREAISLFEMSNEIYKKQDANKQHLAICLGNLADNQMRIGELKVAEANFRRMIEISREIKEGFEEAVGHRKLGQLLAYQGEFGESEKEIEAAIKIAQKLGEKTK